MSRLAKKHYSRLHRVFSVTKHLKDKLRLKILHSRLMRLDDLGEAGDPRYNKNEFTRLSREYSSLLKRVLADSR